MLRQHKHDLPPLRPATGAPTVSNQVEEISAKGAILAIIVRAEFCREGIHFFTEDTLSQQLAFMRHPAGKLIEPHVHNPVRREVQFTQEVLFIRKGRLRVDFYDSDQCYLESRPLDAGDVILLIQGGHGFEVLEEVEMFEVKQGPYVGEGDKTRFAAIDPSRIRLQEGWALQR
jgi:mannose-6-phosphate isomerase-like protein (cupin superfamily)